jgi:hypothetical protein
MRLVREGERKMNKRQWIALGVMFIPFATLESYAVTGYEIVAITGEEIALIIHDAMYSFLMWVCVFSKGLSIYQL